MNQSKAILDRVERLERVCSDELAALDAAERPAGRTDRERADRERGARAELARAERSLSDPPTRAELDRVDAARAELVKLTSYPFRPGDVPPAPARAFPLPGTVRPSTAPLEPWQPPDVNDPREPNPR